MIRRFARLDREEQFLDAYRRQKPTGNPAFHGETLTRLVDDPSMPEALRSFDLREPNCACYVNVATWDSWQECDKTFNPAGAPPFNPEIETAPRQRVVLQIVEGGQDFSR